VAVLRQGKYGLQVGGGWAQRRPPGILPSLSAEIAFAASTLLVALLLGGALQFLGLEGAGAVPHFVLANLCALTLMIVTGLSWFQRSMDRFGSGENELVRRLAVLFGASGLETIAIVFLVDAEITHWLPLVTGTLALTSFFALLALAAMRWFDGFRAVGWVALGSGLLILGQFGLENSTVQLLWPTEAFVALLGLGAEASSSGRMVYGILASVFWIGGVGALVARGLGFVRSPI
jgi:uncharacterized membrane protein YhaH (DUF805 family)